MAEFPVREPLVTRPGLLISERWRIWLRDLSQNLAGNPTRASKPVTIPSANASIGTTAIPSGALAAGLYRVAWYEKVMVPAGVSSSLTFGLSWTDSSHFCSFTDAAMTGNTTSTTQSNTKLVRIDANSPISYSTIYVSNPVNAMQFALAVTLEAVST